MFTLGQTLYLDLGPRGKLEVKVIATGGGHTTVSTVGRWEGLEKMNKMTPAVFYVERGAPKLYKDEDLAKAVVD